MFLTRGITNKSPSSRHEKPRGWLARESKRLSKEYKVLLLSLTASQNSKVRPYC